MTDNDKENNKENLESKFSLASGETYIIFNNLKGQVVVWINCDKEMAIKLSKKDLIEVAPTIFPQIDLSKLLYLISRGDYVFTDKLVLRTLKPNAKADFGVLPTLKSVESNMRVNKSKQFTPFGISF